MHRLNRDRHATDRLCRVEAEQHVILPGDGAHGRGVLDGAQHIGRMGHDNQPGVGRDRLADGVRIDKAVGIERHTGQFDFTAVSHGLKRTADGVVLQRSGDDVRRVVFVQHALDGHVQRIGAVHGEDQPPVVVAVDQAGEFKAHVIEHLLGAHGHAMPRPAGVGRILGEEPDHRGGHLGRLGKTRCCVVEVDHVDEAWGVRLGVQSRLSNARKQHHIADPSPAARRHVDSWPK